MMCEFTEEEVCNCISVPRGVGREKLTKALKLPNVVFELSPHTPHSAKYPVSLARRQTEWSTPLTWRDFSEQITESAAIAFFVSATCSAWSISQPPSTAHLFELPVEIDFCQFLMLKPDATSGRQCGHVSVWSAHVSNMAGIDFLQTDSSAARRI